MLEDNAREDLQQLIPTEKILNDYNDIIDLFNDLNETKAKAMFCAIV